MYCIACGKENPDEARFCAYCGCKLLVAAQKRAADAPAPVQTVYDASVRPAVGESAELAPQQQARPPLAAPVPTAQPKVRPAEASAPKANAANPKPSPVAPFTGRSNGTSGDAASFPPVREYRTLKPATENPAQPNRGVRPARPARAEDDLFLENEPEQTRQEKPAIPGKSPAERRAERNYVLTSRGREEMPARVAPVRRERKATIIPEIAPAKPNPNATGQDDIDDDDVFFQKKKSKPQATEKEHKSLFIRRPRTGSDDADNEDELDDNYVNSRVHKILFGVVFAICLALSFWLFATQSGQVFLAGFGLSRDARAYRTLAARAYDNNQITSAAAAYRTALALDPDDYDTALMTGIAYQAIGKYGDAKAAYNLCTTLRPAEAEAYRYIVQILETQNDTTNANRYRALYKEVTGFTLEE